MSEHRKLFAVLIDGDNVQPSLIPLIINKVEQYGDPVIKKVYGDWSQEHLKVWKDVANHHALDTVHKFHTTKGKNATDIALVIDAMDILWAEKEKLAGFCIVSSDSDFAHLVTRIRRSGLLVLGIGMEQSSESFRNAFGGNYFTIESLKSAQHSKDQRPVERTSNLDSATNTQNLTPEPSVNFGLDGLDRTLQLEFSLLNCYLEEIRVQSENTEGWVDLPSIYERLPNDKLGFSNRRSLAEKAKELADIYRGLFQIHEDLESKPVKHYICIDHDAFRFMLACRYAAEGKKLKDEHGSVMLSVVKSTLQELYPSYDPLVYNGRKFSQFLKIAKEIEKDYPIIRIHETTDGKTQPKVQWLTANS
jgi:hypothetical protein